MEILNKSLEIKLIELKKYISSASVQDVHNLFPKLVEDIFGFGDKTGWGLNENKSNRKLFVDVEDFLKPGGPLIELISSKLVLDSSTFKYEFPIDLLPDASKSALHDLTSGSLFANKAVLINGHLGPNLLLNPFEYYFFNFFVFIVHPKWKNKIDWQGSCSSIYVHLLEDYLRYYLFLEEKSLSLLGFVQLPKTSPISNKYSSYQYPVEHSSDRLINRLISSEPRNVRSQLNWNFDDFWQTTCIIQSAVEFWMNLTPSVKPLDFSNCGEYQLTRNPKADQVNMVRILMKYLYNFVYQKKYVIKPNSPHHQTILNKLQDYKSVFVIRYVCPRLYEFMSYCMDRWPYDLSFNIVLESWLTVIQPWRYQDSALGTDQSKSSSEFDVHEWRPFIASNYPLYANILWCVVLRLQRIDLQVYGNSHMLFRVGKVLSQPHFKRILLQVEDSFSSAYSELNYLPSSPLSESQTTGGFMNLHSRSNGEGGISFTPPMRSDSDLHFIWSDCSRQEVRRLINDAQTAIISIEMKKKCMGTVARSCDYLKELVGVKPLPSTGNNIKQENALRQIAETASFTSNVSYQSKGSPRTLTDYLRSSIENLADFYDVRESLNNPDFHLSFNTKLPPECTTDEDGLTVLSPLGKYQIANNLRRFDIFLPEDPFDLPQQPDENGIILGFTNDLANHINTRFVDNMDSWCRRDNYFGRIARQLFLLNTVRLLYQDEYFQPRNAFISPLTKHHLTLLEKPRLNLRFLANYRLWAYLCLIYCFFYYLVGIESVVLVGIILLLICSFSLMFKALIIPEPALLANYPHYRRSSFAQNGRMSSDHSDGRSRVKRTRPDLMSPTLRQKSSG